MVYAVHAVQIFYMVKNVDSLNYPASYDRRVAAFAQRFNFGSPEENNVPFSTMNNEAPTLAYDYGFSYCQTNLC